MDTKVIELLERLLRVAESMDARLPKALIAPDWSASIAFLYRKRHGNAQLEPVKNIQLIALEQLCQVDIQKQKIWENTEQFIEDKYPVDIRYGIKIDCEVSQNGFREHFLTEMLAKRIPLLAKKKLLFTISEINVPEPYSIEWKVLNRGEEAKKRNCIRGKIVSDDGQYKRKESTNFKGDHIVECFVIKDGIVVAKDRIDVPIRWE